MKNSASRAGRGPRTGFVCERDHRDVFEARGRSGRRLLAAIAAVALLALPSSGLAADDAREVSRESGLGAAAALSSLIYSPLKLAYATGGLVVGSFAWIFTAGDTEVASKVFTRSLRGTYVITPEILLGEQRLEFIGEAFDDVPARRAENVASARPQKQDPYEAPTYDDLGW